MTKRRDFKKLVRERMAKTGERYAAARAHLLAARQPQPDYPGLVPGYRRCGGVQTESSALRNVLECAGARHPDGAPWSEALVHGLCGGVGFLYGVFEYEGYGPTMTIVGRSRSMPDWYLDVGLEHCGADVERYQTTSANKARTQLDAVLDAGRPALVTVDPVRLPYYGLPERLAGMGPHVLAVIGRDGEDVWVDDRCARPIRVSADALAQARASYRKGKHRLTDVVNIDREFDLADAVTTALARALVLYDEPPARPFASNVGTAGLEKWARLLIDPRDKKGWPTVFGSTRRAYVGLHRAYDCTQHDYTAPDAGRPLFAQFLDEAATLTGLDGLRGAADQFREAGRHWAALSRRIAECGDPAIERACAIADERAALLDERGAQAASAVSALNDERIALANECALEASAAGRVFADLAALVSAIAAVERAALDRVRAALATDDRAS